MSTGCGVFEFAGRASSLGMRTVGAALAGGALTCCDTGIAAAKIKLLAKKVAIQAGIRIV